LSIIYKASEMSTQLNFPSADQDIFIRGDNQAVRTITIGQQVTFKDRFVIDCENISLATNGDTVFGLVASGGDVTVRGALSTPTRSSSTNNEAFGSGALGSIVSGFGNNACGFNSLPNLTTGGANMGYGFNAGSGVITGSNNMCIGSNTLTAADLSDMVAIGTDALRNTGVGATNNIGIGFRACQGSAVTPHTGSFNTAIGNTSMQVIEGTATNNTAVGGQALQSLTTAIGNTCIGKDAGKLVSTGGSNVFIGNATGDNTTTGASNILIGSGLDTTSASTTGELKIHFAGGANVPLISGDMVAGKLGVNTETHTGTLSAKTDDGDNVDCLFLDQNDDGQALVRVEATESTGVLVPLTSFTSGASIVGFMQITVNGVKEWVPRYSDPTS
jgi:uncharacterized membrane protein YoaK (UPF0700 family)